MPWLLRLWLCLWVAAPALAVPALWQVGQGRSTISLYGTIHALPPGQTWLSDTAGKAFNSADGLVVEVVMPEDSSAMADVLAQMGLLQVPVPLASRLPAAVRPQLAAALKAGNLPAGAMDQMKTWLAALTLVQLDLARAGLNATQGVDVTLMARAKAMNKPVTGLETARGQFALFDSLPEAEQRRLLAAAVTESGDVPRQLQGLVSAWLAGDVNRILRDFDDASLSPELERRLFVTRNRAWVTWVQKALKTPGRRFMAVGAAHMAGPRGLVAMLKARGIKVRRVE